MIPHTETNLNGTNINSFPKSIQNTNEFSENSKKEPLPCLYVGDLSLNLSEIDVEKIFSKIVPIKSVKIYRDITSGESLGYCFVEFENFKDAEKALNALNYYYDPEKMKKPFRLMWYQQDKNLRKYLGGNIFLKDLPLDFTSKNLEKMFFEFGKILSCKVALDESGRSLGYGFVHFENENASKEAIQKTNGVVIGGKKIFVGPFYSKKERKIDGKPKQGFTNIYIKNILIENCNEKFIKDLFDIFGKITSIYIPKFTNRIKGIAFVNFEFPEEAEEAVFGMNKKKIKNLTLYVGKAETKVERQRNLKKKFLERKINPVEKPQNSILIKINIPISITEDVLISKITSVVIIKNCKVLFNSNKDLKKHSFVWFYNLENFSKLIEKNKFFQIEKKKFVRFSDISFFHSCFNLVDLNIISSKGKENCILKRINLVFGIFAKIISSKNSQKIQISVYKLVKRTCIEQNKKKNIQLNSKNFFLKKSDILCFFFCNKFLKKIFF